MNNSIKYDNFLEILGRWVDKGVRITKFGTRLICPAPHIAPEAWFHVLYRGLNNEEIAKLQNKIYLPLPGDFTYFLSRSNGASLFGYHIEIWGLRFSYVRRGEEAWQPYDIELHNQPSERPLHRPPYILMFGSTDKGESRLFFDARNGTESSRVGKTSLKKFEPIQFWPDFWTWLLEETKRLALLFDEFGRPIEKEARS